MLIKKLIHLSYLLIYVLRGCDNKYVEGELHTSENWAFIARFCFLSDEGQFEFFIEFEEDQGYPNLLLYYDADDQWPAIYKSPKHHTCQAKESVLRIEQNQIVNLTMRFPYRDAAGCVATQQTTTTPAPKYPYQMPTLATKQQRPPKTTTLSYNNDGSSTVLSDFATTTTNYYDGDVDNQTAFTTSIFTEDGLDVSLTTTTHTPNTSKRRSKSIPNFTDDDQDDLISKIAPTTIKEHSSTTEDVDHEYIPSTTTIIKRRRALLSTYYQYPSGRHIICRNARRFRSSRERWWFIAISNCNGSKGIHIKYKLLMTNGPPGDYWHEHFSADEFYVLPVLMAFSVAYAFLILAIVVCSIELKSRQLLHSTYKLFVLSVIVQFFGIIFKSMSFLKYAINGVGNPPIKTFGAMLMGISETCFLLLLLLLAKGYTVTRGRLPIAAGVKLTIFMCLYVVTYVSLFIYEAKVFDPGEVLYTYESPAGYGLIILRIIAWCMFIYSTVFTLKHYPEKANFYYPFNVFGTLWFIAGPAFIISANTYIDKWVRESVVCAVLLFITFGGHLMFLLLTMPSVANKNFPYHVRTTQIGIMEHTGMLGNNSIEQFGHHLYEPSTVNGIEQTVIVPLSKRSEEIFGGLYTQRMTSTTLTRNNNHDDDELDRRTIRNGGDITMENVLNWSLAKNFATLETTTHSDVVEEEDKSLPPALPEANSLQRNGAVGGHLDDWVKEVPVELFTISKMVITKQQQQKNQQQTTTTDSD